MARFERDSPTCGNGSDALGKRGVRENVSAELEEAAIVEVHPDRSVESNCVGTDAVGDDHERIKARTGEYSGGECEIRVDDPASSHDAGAIPIECSRVIDVAAAIT